MAEKRIIFNTSTPNDQGGVIPNETLDFERFDMNPVLLLEHQWGNPTVSLLGSLKDRKLIGGKWTGVPDFHGCTENSRICKDLFEKGYLNACSIGGFAEWKTNSAGQPELDGDGNRVCALFDLYEVSMCSLPSNRDAVALAAAEAANYAKAFDKADLPKVGAEIVKLSSQLKQYKVEPTPEQLAAKLAELEKSITALKAEKANAEKVSAQSEIEKKIVAAEAELNQLKADKEKAEKEAADKLKAGGSTDIPADAPGILKMILDFGRDIIGLKGKGGPTEIPPAETPKVEIINPVNAQDKLPTKIELKAKKVEEAKKKADEARKKAEEALDEAKKAKEKAEKEDAGEDDTDAYEKAREKANKAMQDAKDCEKALKDAEDADEDEMEAEEEAKKKSEKEKSENAARGNKGTTTSTKPQLKTMEQLNAEHATIVPFKRSNAKAAIDRVTFSALSAEAVKNPQSNEGKIFNRVMKGAEERTTEDYAVLAAAMLNDPKLAAIRDNVRIHSSLRTKEDRHQVMVNPKTANGSKLEDVYGRISTNNYSALSKEGTLLSGRERVTLTGTDTLLASPDLFTIEWLALVIYTLYPSTGWKKDIPVFSAQDTYNNTGLIWTNIAADPTISRGTPPSNATPYQVGDTAVSLAMVPYYLPDMLFTPITMHQFRYDQMGAQWAQAFAKWGAIMDDNFINTFALIAPNTAWYGSTGANTAIGAGPNKFYYNQSYTGNVANAAYNDVAAIEQIYKAQNFDMTMESNKAVLVLDSIMERGILQDPDTKSYLTRWVKSNDKSDDLSISHTQIIERSRVAVYDPSTQQVKDINASIPSTAQSAGLGFIPSQLGIGLGMLDVFVLQSAKNYGFEMSANIRAGANALRANFAGLSLYNFGTSV